MKKNIFFILLLFANSFLYSQSEQKFVEIGDLFLISGDTLLDCRLGYRTFGELNLDSSNIVIFPTWFGGTSEDVSKLIGPIQRTGLKSNGKLLDNSQLFIIIFDAISNGISSSPSNSIKQNGGVFPEITIEDMINSQYVALTEHFGIHHAHAIIGGSMGGMQALQWVVSYPNFFKKAVPYVASPRRSTYDQLVMYFRTEIINSYRELGANDTLIQKLLNINSAILARSPKWIIDNTDIDNLEEYLIKFETSIPSELFTIDNYLSQLRAMRTHNIYKDFNNSIELTSKHIKTKVFIILNKRDMLVNPTPAFELAQELECKILMLDNNCGHLGIGCEIERCSIEIHEFLLNSN